MHNGRHLAPESDFYITPLWDWRKLFRLTWVFVLEGALGLCLVHNASFPSYISGILAFCTAHNDSALTDRCGTVKVSSCDKVRVTSFIHVLWGSEKWSLPITSMAQSHRQTCWEQMWGFFMLSYLSCKDTKGRCTIKQTLLINCEFCFGSKAPLLSILEYGNFPHSNCTNP